MSVFNACEPHELQVLNSEKVKLITTMMITAEGDDMVNATCLHPKTVRRYMKPGMNEIEVTRDICERIQAL